MYQGEFVAKENCKVNDMIYTFFLQTLFWSTWALHPTRLSLISELRCWHLLHGRDAARLGDAIHHSCCHDWRWWKNSSQDMFIWFDDSRDRMFNWYDIVCSLVSICSYLVLFWIVRHIIAIEDSWHEWILDLNVLDHVLSFWHVRLWSLRLVFGKVLLIFMPIFRTSLLFCLLYGWMSVSFMALNFVLWLVLTAGCQP